MKRLVATVLWFASFLYLFELLSVLFGIPRVLGPIAAVVVAGGVWLDPMHWIWPAQSPEAHTKRQPSAAQSSTAPSSS